MRLHLHISLFITLYIQKYDFVGWRSCSFSYIFYDAIKIDWYIVWSSQKSGNRHKNWSRTYGVFSWNILHSLLMIIKRIKSDQRFAVKKQIKNYAIKIFVCFNFCLFTNRGVLLFYSKTLLNKWESLIGATLFTLRIIKTIRFAWRETNKTEFCWQSFGLIARSFMIFFRHELF